MKHYYHNTHKASLPALSSQEHKRMFEFFKKRVKSDELFEQVCRDALIEQDDDPGKYYNKFLVSCRKHGIVIK